MSVRDEEGKATYLLFLFEWQTEGVVARLEHSINHHAVNSR